MRRPWRCTGAENVYLAALIHPNLLAAEAGDFLPSQIAGHNAVNRK
jgi:hypothetical protein